ncbi:SpaH/EbpB family LPXTG-anchored major pilin [Arthrobacter sp. N199823]|uniref:SpaH/EbpB family LPXTG-anchored major pilin n=1 Tax=Arthrobacter sp. N199823 TaxID=2058895 RepID=UPI000CE54850|nr:SpaH/EbpB family LPXTG-anchored major pilin [Arthrobacter sp. N199823]
MSTGRNPLKRRITAGLGIAALATAALFGSMLPASAADAGNIDTAAAKSLTIHKFAQPATQGTAPNGLELQTPPPAADALVGVHFKIEKVTNIDLRTNAGWAATKTLKPADVAGNLEFIMEDKTAAGGVLKFDGLEQAVYLVTETAPGTNNIAFAAQPFLVTLPLPNTTDNTWIYDVHVYPKNSLSSITKTVNDSAAQGLGSKVTWNIAATVPNTSEGNSLKSFAIEDVLDPRLTFSGATVSLVPANGLLATDYEIDSTTVPGTVKINFKASGLAKLTPGTSVQVALDTTVTTLDGNGSGIITNDASVFVNDNKATSDKVQTNWGNVIIHKVSAGESKKNLQGAEFQVYATEADAKAGNNPISVSGETVFTTNADGIVNIAGLKAKNNGAGADITYWLVETKAPAGYNISTTVSKESPKSFTVNTEITTAVDIVVENVQTPPFTLPLTGGSGTAMFMTVGLGLLAVAGGVALRKRSTRRTVQA